MRDKFKIYRVGESCGMEGENEIVVEAEYGVMRDVYGTGDSPSEWFFEPIKVTIDGFEYSWEELYDYEQEEVEHQASQDYIAEQTEQAKAEYEAWLETNDMRKEMI